MRRAKSPTLSTTSAISHPSFPPPALCPERSHAHRVLTREFPLSTLFPAWLLVDASRAGKKFWKVSAPVYSLHNVTMKLFKWNFSEFMPPRSLRLGARGEAAPPAGARSLRCQKRATAARHARTVRVQRFWACVLPQPPIYVCKYMYLCVCVCVCVCVYIYMYTIGD